MRQVRLYERAHRAIGCLDFFTTHQWRFISENPIRLLDFLSEKDKQTFYFDVRQIDWSSYIETYVLGARRFILKDDPSTLPEARRNLNRYVARLDNHLAFLNRTLNFQKKISRSVRPQDVHAENAGPTDAAGLGGLSLLVPVAVPTQLDTGNALRVWCHPRQLYPPWTSAEPGGQGNNSRRQSLFIQSHSILVLLSFFSSFFFWLISCVFERERNIIFFFANAAAVLSTVV